MADVDLVGVAETGTYSTSSPNPHVDLSGSSPGTYGIEQLVGDIAANGDKVKCTVRKDRSNWAVYRNATYTTGSPNLIDLSSAVLADSKGTLSNSDSVEVIGLAHDNSDGFFLCRSTASGTAQTISANTHTAVNSSVMDTEVIDRNGWLSGSRFTPQRAGYYQIGGLAVMNGLNDGIKIQVGISKNGGNPGSNPQNFVFLSRGYTGNTFATTGFGGAQIMYANGSTDYFDLVVYHDQASGTVTVPVVENYAYFWGFFVHE